MESKLSFQSAKTSAVTIKGILFVLKKNEMELAVAEAKASMHGWGWWEHTQKDTDGTIFFPRMRKVPRELALTRRIVKVLATCAPRNVYSTLNSIKWQSIIRNRRYSLRLTKQVDSELKEREVATIVWRKISKPRIDLLSPDVVIEVVITSKRAYIGLRADENKGDFEVRRAHLMPAPHPTMLHPSLARALVDLSCASRIHDPFCGSGGFLIEAGLAGKRISGADIDTKMLARARKNCSSYHLRPELRVADATMWMPRVSAIVSDLPYGKNTKPVKLAPLLEAFLERARVSTKRLVIGLPCEIPSSKGWRIRAHFTSYVHKLMTRHFYVLEKKE